MVSDVLAICAAGVILAEYILALKMAHSENETVESSPGVHLFIPPQQCREFGFQVFKQSPRAQKGSVASPGDGPPLTGPQPCGGHQASSQAFEFQPRPHSVATSSGNCD